MKKRIEEVMEKASKGPFSVPEKLGYPVSVIGSEHCLMCNANGENQDIAVLNAALIAHSLNNLGPMLEALKEATSMIRAEWIEDSASTIMRCEKAIEAASQVEVG